MWKLRISSESYVYCKKCVGYVSHSRMCEHQNYHEKLGNLVSEFSFCAFETFFRRFFVRKLQFSSKLVSDSESALKTESIYICCG